MSVSLESDANHYEYLVSSNHRLLSRVDDVSMRV